MTFPFEIRNPPIKNMLQEKKIPRESHPTWRPAAMAPAWHAMIKVNFSNYQVEATQRQLTDNSGETEHVDRMILCRVCWGFKAHTVLSLLDQSPGISVHLRKAFRICQKRGQSSSLGGLGCKYNRIFEERNISEISFHTCWRWNLPKNRVNMQVKKLRFHDVL